MPLLYLLFICYKVMIAIEEENIILYIIVLCSYVYNIIIIYRAINNSWRQLLLLRTNWFLVCLDVSEFRMEVRFRVVSTKFFVGCSDFGDLRTNRKAYYY